MEPDLTGKQVLLGVTGGIAAYKVHALVRELRVREAAVRVVLTAGGETFVSRAALETLSEHRIYTALFEPETPVTTVHIELARWAQALVIAPATANFLAKARMGLADDLLSTIALSYDRPILFAPAMNDKMWEHPATRENVDVLRRRGHQFLGPVSGALACKTDAIGRMVEPEIIVTALERTLLATDALRGTRVVITAGPTREPLDPVRYLSNHSSGRMGFALAEEAFRRGAAVTVIAGPTTVPPPPDIPLVRVETADEMARAVHTAFRKADVLIAAAAVCDFRPDTVAARKIKRRQGGMRMSFTDNEDILERAGKRKGKRLTIGFALETDRAADHAREKMLRKNCDLMVINNPLEPGAGFGGDTNRVSILHRDDTVEDFPVQSKQAVAAAILDRVAQLVHGVEKRQTRARRA